MKDYFIYQGNTRIMGSRDATREAFQKNMIADGENWMNMIVTRNKALHTYDEITVAEVIRLTTTNYYSLFLEFEKVMQQLSDAK